MMQKNNKLKISAKWGWFTAFTLAFSILAAWVFWGTWSPDVAPVMPDDSVVHPLTSAEQFKQWLAGWKKNGTFTPFAIFWDGYTGLKYWVQEFKYALALYLSGLGLAYFLRGRGLSYLASYGAGLLLGFCGYWCTLFSAGHGGWFILMSSMILCFAFCDRAITHGRLRDWILLGASVGWSSCFQPDLFLLFAIFLVAYGIYACWRERKFPWKGALIALAFFAAVGAPGIRSAFQDALVERNRQIEESMGTPLTGGKGGANEKATEAEKAKQADEARWIFVTNWSMPPEDTLEFFCSRIHGDTSCPMSLQLARMAHRDVRPYTGRLGRPINAPAGNYRQHSLYVGWVTCLLVVAGVIGYFRTRSKDILFFTVAAVLFWVLSMGRFCEPVYRLVYMLPFGDSLRAPVKWHHLTEFCLCLLAAFGIEATLGWLKAHGVKAKVAIGVMAGVVLFGAADLARAAHIFCAPIDMRIVRGRNAVAEDVTRLGKGAVCDLVEGGNGLVSWSFSAHGVGVTREFESKDTRFILVGNEQVKRTPQLARALQQRATLVGTYLLTHEGFRHAAAQASNVSLYQVNGVPPQKPNDALPPMSNFILALALVSLAGTIVALIVGIRTFI